MLSNLSEQPLYYYRGHYYKNALNFGTKKLKTRRRFGLRRFSNRRFSRRSRRRFGSINKTQILYQCVMESMNPTGKVNWVFVSNCMRRHGFRAMSPRKCENEYYNSQLD